MYCLMYFDVEDFLSPPDHPVHLLPGQFAEIMTRHGLPGSFHIIGEKVRFMERHGQKRVIDAIRKHDVSLHFDRGSIHPTTAEEVSHLDWFQGVDRVIFRELPGIQTLERVFGKCSAITRHGATYATQIAYAAGKLGKPFFSSPFNLPGRNVAWFCNNLAMATGEGGGFDRDYRDTPAFEKLLEVQNAHLHQRMKEVDFVPLFGCHPLITIMEEFPCALNFKAGVNAPREQWKAPTMIPGVSIPTVLANFERRIKDLARFPGLEWTTTDGLARLYGQRPVRVTEAVVLDAARAVVDHGGPTYTQALSAGELLYLLARRKLAPAAVYEVPQIMGPVFERSGAVHELQPVSAWRPLCMDVIEAAHGSGYLPERLGDEAGRLSLEAALVALACDAIGTPLSALKAPRLTVESIPGFADAAQEVSKLKNWRIHEPGFDQANLSKYFRWQAWTLKPAYRADEYGAGIELGTHLNPALPFAMKSP
jgi:hypothetical protein